MPYYINRTNGTSLVTVQDGVTDSTVTSIQLVGKNFPTYGQLLNQNLVSMLENFSNTSSPDNALIGQLWYDSNEKSLRVYREGSTTNSWQKLAVTTESSEEPVTPRHGDFWWDTDNSQLKLYDAIGLSWKIIGPQTANDGQLRVSGSNFNVQVAGNTVFKVDNFGGVTLRTNPCVYGYDNMSSTTLTTGNLLAYTTWVPKKIIDRGNNFNETTGVFTVNTAGAYRVEALITTLGGPSTVGANEMRLRWQKNSAEVNINSVANHNEQETHQLACAGIIQAAVGDTIRLVFSSQSGAYFSYQNASYSIQLIG